MPSLAKPSQPLRVMCLEDNPLIALHLEHMVEDLGHRIVETCDSWAEARLRFDRSAIDCVLIDIDLADGRTGPLAAAWLRERGVPALFVTGQEALARDHLDLVAGVIAKPVSMASLEDGLRTIAEAA